MERTYHDPLHGAISLNSSDPTEALLIQLIDTPAFQRLRRIRQLGPASVTFHGAESSRFTHSLGVLAIARRAFDRLVQFNPSLWVHRPVVLCGALLHDLGHGPFSHTGEEIFGSHHEHWTVRILQESQPLYQALDRFQPGLVKALIQVYAKSYPVPLVWQLVTSQLDCDRLDYLMRDSYFTGTTYGKIDLERILMALGYDPETQQLTVMQKGMAAIEHYLIVRYFMYAQVYNHAKNIAASWVLQQSFARARVQIQAGRLEADETVQAWLTQDCDQLPLKCYLDADDGVFHYHLQRWQGSRDPILADLCRRYVDRDLLKAQDISALEEGDRTRLLGQVQDGLSQLNLEPQIYSGLRVSLSRGYTLYQRGIKVQTAHGLEELSHLSPLVRMLTNAYERVWLIYPREIEPQLVTLAGKSWMG
ncbi:MAG TPA: HD domain-containing protein [Coleofasciculaceae cyanobacterium]